MRRESNSNAIPIKSSFPGKIKYIVTGLVAVGTTFIEIEAMKMNTTLNPIHAAGTFIAIVIGGKLVKKGDIIGYFYPKEKTDKVEIESCDIENKELAFKKAVSNGYKEIVEHLLTDGEQDISNEAKGLALRHAAENGHKELVKLLIKKCANDISSKDMVVAFSCQQIKEDKDLVKTLVKSAPYTTMACIVAKNIISPSFLKEIGFAATAHAVKRVSEALYPSPDKDYDQAWQSRISMDNDINKQR